MWLRPGRAWHRDPHGSGAPLPHGSSTDCRWELPGRPKALSCHPAVLWGSSGLQGGRLGGCVHPQEPQPCLALGLEDKEGSGQAEAAEETLTMQTMGSISLSLGTSIQVISVAPGSPGEHGVRRSSTTAPGMVREGPRTCTEPVARGTEHGVRGQQPQCLPLPGTTLGRGSPHSPS